MWRLAVVFALTVGCDSSVDGLIGGGSMYMNASADAQAAGGSEIGGAEAGGAGQGGGAPGTGADPDGSAAGGEAGAAAGGTIGSGGAGGRAGGAGGGDVAEPDRCAAVVSTSGCGFLGADFKYVDRSKGGVKCKLCELGHMNPPLFKEGCSPEPGYVCAACADCCYAQVNTPCFTGADCCAPLRCQDNGAGKSRSCR